MRPYHLRSKAVPALLVVAALVLVGLGGVAYATYDFTKRHGGRLLPGTTIAGVDVGGLNDAEALVRVKRQLGDELDRKITVRRGKRTFVTTPRELGVQHDAELAVAAAMEASAAASVFDHARMSVLRHGVDFRRGIEFTYPPGKAHKFLRKIAREIDRESRDASIDHSSGWVQIVRDRPGRRLAVAKARRALMGALRNGGSNVDFEVRKIEPKVTADEFDKVLLVRIGENRLYLYQRGEITHSWRIATGQPGSGTPTGVFEITEKRYMPTWVNPGPRPVGARACRGWWDRDRAILSAYGRSTGRRR